MIACFGKEAVFLEWYKSTENTEKPTIVQVGALDGDCFDITLSNGHAILLDLGSRIKEPEFAALIENGCLEKPQTDGARLYWPEGPSLTLAEIFSMLTAGDNPG